MNAPCAPERDREGGRKRESERKESAKQLVTDSAGSLSSQFVLLIEDWHSLHITKCISSNASNFLAAEDSADAVWLGEIKV